MNLVTLDFETFFCNKTYSVKKMGTEPYVRDARFQAHGCGIKLWGQTCWYPHAQLVGERPQDRKGLFGDIDWSNTAVLCHHAHFDGLILAHHYGVRPALWLDTLSMARAILGNHISLSLDDLRRHFWMPVKHTPYHLFDGKQWNELDAPTRDLIAAGCCDEVESIEQIFRLLMAGAGTKRPFPIEELAVIDMTIRAFTEPVLKADMQLLGEIWWEEHNTRAERLTWLNIDKKAVGGVESFAELLREAGVEPEYKVGKPNPDGSIKLIYAFAKTDDFMRELLEDDDDYIRTLAEARIGAKSTLLQSRAERIADMATRGNLCIYLKYAAANTLRWGGGDKTNFQNLRRSDPETKKVSKLRRAIGSAPDEWIAGPDESQIECRLLNFCAGQWDVVEKFRRKEDPYVGIASAFYQRPITKADEAERGTGKQAELSCGYGSSGPKFVRTAALGTYGPPVSLTAQQGRDFVGLYRETHPAICSKPDGLWAFADNVMLPALARGDQLVWGPCVIADRRIWMPNGLPLLFDTLEYAFGPQFLFGKGWQLKRRNGWQVMYGSKLVQNLMEALGRCIVSQAMIRIRQRTGLRFALTSHDNIIYTIKRDERAEATEAIIKEEMIREPSWLPGIPLDVDSYLGERMEK